MIDICCVISFLVHGQTDKHRERETDRQTDEQTDENERQGDSGYWQ